MRKSKFIPMLLIPAAFVACTNEDILDNCEVNEMSKDVVKNVVFNVSLDEGVNSRGAYAGSTSEDGAKSPFKNFYLEPKFDATTSALVLSNNTALAGDMMGFCLTNGASAVTNLPFYVAGYGSTKATTKGALTTIYPFAAHTNGTKVWTSTETLYNLNLDNTLYTVGSVITKDEFDASVNAIAASGAGEDLEADALDVRKAIVRNNAGVMTGDYIAYYPYNAEFTEPGGVPVKELSDLYVLTIAPTATTREDALEAYTATSFKDNLFAISRATNHVNGQTKSGDVSVVPMTAINVFRLVNTAETVGSSYKNKDIQVKRITVTAASNPEKTDFALAGSVALNDLNKIVATKSNSIVGVQFPGMSIANGYDPDDTETPQIYVSLPFYPVSGKQIKIEVYSTNGKVAEVVKSNVPTLGNAYTWTIDLGELDFVETTRKVFTAADFIAEAATAGNLKLMRDIEVTDAVACNQALNIEGDYKLTLSAATISKNMTFAEGTTVELKGTTTLSGDAVLTADKVILNKTGQISNRIVADEVTIPASCQVSLVDAEIEILNNNGVIRCVNTENTAVEITTLNNNKGASFRIGKGYAATVGTIENNAGAEIVLKGALTATTINNDAKIPAVVNVSAEVAAAVVTVEDNATTDIADINGEATLNNAGTVNWASTSALDFTINNSGSFNVTNECNFSGVFTNTGDFIVAADGKVEGIAGSVTNSTNGYMNVLGYFGFTTTKLNINAGVVEDNGTINGNTNVTVTEGAEFIGNAADDNTLISALSDFNINSKYTGINVTGNVNWPSTVTSTAKKIYQKANITFAKSTALNGGLEVAANGTVTATKGLTITEVLINSEATWTIAASSNVTVSGIITNNGTYSQNSSAVVWCNGIAGTGNWGSLKPRY